MRCWRLLALLIAGAGAAGAQTTNLIRNPGFEAGTTAPAEWVLGMEGHGAGSARWVTENPRSGTRAVRLEMLEAGNYWMARQTYPAGTARPEHPYRLSGWYRGTEGVCHPCVYFRNKEGTFLGAWETTLAPAKEWRFFDFVFATPPGTDHFELQLRAQGVKGVCWFDDVALEDAEALAREGQALVASLLAAAKAHPDTLWALVSNGGRVEWEFVGSPTLEVAWATAGVPGEGTTARYGVRLETGSRPGKGSPVVRGPRNSALRWQRLRLPAGRQRTRLVAYVDGAGARPVLLVGVKATRDVTASLARLQADPVDEGNAAMEVPWQTRLLPETAERFAAIRQANRGTVLRTVLGAAPGKAVTRVCSAWHNLTDDGWLEWALSRPGRAPVPAGARNEYLSLQVLFVPPGRPRQVTAQPTALRGPHGATIPASACQVRMLEYVPFQGKWWPDPLMEAQPFTPPAHGPIVFWITLHVPPDARPGLYRGALRLRADDGPVVTQPFAVRVWNVTLPSETHLQSSFWLFRAQIRRYFDLPGDLPLEDYFPYIDLATSHRLSPIDVVEGPAEPLVKVYREADGSLSYDFSEWDRYLDRLRQGGANTIHLGFTHWMANWFTGQAPAIIDRQTGAVTAPGHAFGSKEHLDALAHYLRAAANHLKQRGEFEKCYIQPWDEPHGDGLAKSHLVLEGLRDRVPEIPRLMDAVAPETFDGRMKDVVNLWCPLSPGVEGGVFDGVRQRGDTLWWYVCLAPGRPYANLFTNWKVAEMRALFWQTWQVGATGILYWGLNYWLHWDAPVPPPEKRFPNGPWVASTTYRETIGDGYFIYPGPAVDQPLSSLRLETIRDGIEDYELLYLLRGLVEQRSDADAATLRLAREVLKVRPGVSKNLREFDRDGAAIDAERQVIARLIERLQR